MHIASRSLVTPHSARAVTSRPTQRVISNGIVTRTHKHTTTSMDEEKLREAFAKFDADGSGLIDSAELKAALQAAYDDCGEEISDDIVNQLVETIMAAVDTSGDGKVSLEEFIKAIQANCAVMLTETAVADEEADNGDQK